MAEYFERTYELGREGLPGGIGSYIEENITNGKEVNIGVELSRYQYREASSPEGSILMPSQDDDGQQILNILRELTPGYLAYALALAKGAKFSDPQDISASPLATSGEQYPLSAQ